MSTDTTTFHSPHRRLSPSTLLAYLMFAVLLLALTGAGAGTWAIATRGSSSAAAATRPASSDAKSTLQTVSSDAKLNSKAQPAAGWTPRDPALPPAAASAVHDVTLEIVEKDIAVAPGVTQRMWTFNGTVPAPVLRGKVGDTFNITLVNHGTFGHSIDFHASEVAPNLLMKTILPGQTLVYSFVAHHSGIFMYHCGTAPALQHIAEGMYGAVVIDPPGLPAVDHEYFMLQSEFYFGRPGKLGDYTKMTDFAPDAVVFNGYYNQYAYSPIKVQHGQRVRIWVMDEGPSENSSFHVVGGIWDTVFKEGSYLLRPGPSAGGSQTLDLQPAQGGFVEFVPAQAGQYTFVTHKFSNVVKGAAGYVQAS
ncbi:MAG TPA: multicopper oxidase domain-containing protein [Candidatus Dormibacteraeota bacterium]|nr:multicopper oxidase domain-containing protein [Candidatus Dormibacteraeota bacterium]